MIKKIYNGYVREIFFHVYKEGVDLQNSKKFIKKISKKNKEINNKYNKKK
jgi:DnaJ-domain-containing protein 1